MGSDQSHERKAEEAEKETEKHEQCDTTEDATPEGKRSTPRWKHSDVFVLLRSRQESGVFLVTADL